MFMEISKHMNKMVNLQETRFLTEPDADPSETLFVAFASVEKDSIVIHKALFFNEFEHVIK